MVKQEVLDGKEIQACPVYLVVTVHLVSREMMAVTAGQVRKVHLVSTAATVKL